MNSSDQTNELAKALAAAQAAMKNATLNKVNSHFRNKYADLAGIRDTVIPVLAKHGLSVVQALGPDGVTTRLMHESGQWVESVIPLPQAQDMQKLGSAITYARRYGLSAICCIAADEDDDANATAGEPIDHGYDDFLAALEEIADKGTPALLAAIKADDVPEAWRARLRSETRTWNALKARATKAQAA